MLSASLFSRLPTSLLLLCVRRATKREMRDGLRTRLAVSLFPIDQGRSGESFAGIGAPRGCGIRSNVFFLRSTRCPCHAYSAVHVNPSLLVFRRLFRGERALQSVQRVVRSAAGFKTELGGGRILRRVYGRR